MPKKIKKHISIALENNNFYNTDAYLTVTDPKFLSEIIIKNNIFEFYKNLLDDLINSTGHLNLKENIVEALNTKDNIFLINVMDLVINNLIQKGNFPILSLLLLGCY